MNILEKIIKHKRQEVATARDLVPVKVLERSLFFDTVPVSMKKYLTKPNQPGIIAEIKRKSPSEGVINMTINVEKLSIGYMQAGAAALSVLTDQEFFGGTDGDLRISRKFNFCPILRKDFIVDEYQILEAKSMGADCILLIASALTPTETGRLSAFARSFGLGVLLEVHHEDEIASHLNQHIDVLGVNNRDLTTFKTDIDNSKRMAEYIPNHIVKISESGITSVSDIRALQSYGYDGFLIGTLFMKTQEPHITCKKFIHECKVSVV